MRRYAPSLRVAKRCRVRDNEDRDNEDRDNGDDDDNEEEEEEDDDESATSCEARNRGVHVSGGEDSAARDGNEYRLSKVSAAKKCPASRS